MIEKAMDLHGALSCHGRNLLDDSAHVEHDTLLVQGHEGLGIRNLVRQREHVVDAVRHHIFCHIFCFCLLIELALHVPREMQELYLQGRHVLQGGSAVRLVENVAVWQRQSNAWSSVYSFAGLARSLSTKHKAASTKSRARSNAEQTVPALLALSPDPPADAAQGFLARTPCSQSAGWRP